MTNNSSPRFVDRGREGWGHYRNRTGYVTADRPHIRTWCTTYSTYLTFHGIRVNLTHILSSVLLLDAAYVQIPRGVIVMGHGYTWIMRDHVIVYRLNRLSVRLHPANLKHTVSKWIIISQLLQ